MRTTINIDDSVLENLLEYTHQKSKTRAITIAIKDYLRRKRLEKILSFQGKLDVEDNWQQLEEEEMKEYAEKK